MPFLKYTGLSHYRQLLKSDLAKAGVQIDQALTFAKHEVVEVTDEIADAIHKLVGDEFEKVQDDVDREFVRVVAEDPQPTSAVPGTFIPQVTESDDPDLAPQPQPAPLIIDEN